MKRTVQQQTQSYKVRDRTDKGRTTAYIWSLRVPQGQRSLTWSAEYSFVENYWSLVCIYYNYNF